MNNNLYAVVKGNHRKIAKSIPGHLAEEFCQQFGMGQYSHIRFVEWLVENHPEVIEQYARTKQT